MPEVESVTITATETTVPDTFEAYEAKRSEELKPSFAADVEDVEVVDTPEPTESAPVTEEMKTPPAASETKPEGEAPTDPGPVETQEEKDKKQKGIPQKRLDEQVKARGEAERALEAEKARAADLERKLAEAEAKAKPADPVKPTETAPAETKAVEEIPKPATPKMPTLEDTGGDWDKHQEELAEYYAKTYPDFVEKLTDWKEEQRETARAKQIEVKNQADAKAKSDADKAASVSAEEKDWNDRIQVAKDKYPDWEETINTPVDPDPKVLAYSPAMHEALKGMPDSGELIYYLAKHPEESKRIAAMTPHQDGLPAYKYRALLATAFQELIGVRGKLQVNSEAAPPPPAKVDPSAAVAAAAAVAATAATAVATAVPAATPATAAAVATPKPPENQKPATSRAPRPPVPVSENAGAPVKDPKDAAIKGDFEVYERLRRSQARR